MIYEEDMYSDTEKAPEDVQNPEHYRGHPSGVDLLTIVQHESFFRGNILKYVYRAPYKGQELEDLLKAQKYLELEIERLTFESS